MGLLMPHDATDLPDVNEYGLERDGERQRSNRRLFMQLLVLESAQTVALPNIESRLISALEGLRTPAVVYQDVNHPGGFGVLTWTESPTDFFALRALLAEPALGVTLRPGQTMLGRTYSSGFEQDLEYWLIKRPHETVLNEAWPWAVWYPLRRKGSFEELDGRTKAEIMREHANIGKAYGKADLAHDIRLACHGLDPNDNDFVIGLVGRELFPLSNVVQAMRKTRQTREFIERMGPFFVGRAVHRVVRQP
jgi:chlorite dismutase